MPGKQIPIIALRGKEREEALVVRPQVSIGVPGISG